MSKSINASLTFDASFFENRLNFLKLKCQTIEKELKYMKDEERICGLYLRVSTED